MFFHRQPQSDLRTRLVDQLLEASATERKELLDRATGNGELKRGEADELLRLVARLESVLRSEAPRLPDSLVAGDSTTYAA